MQINSHLSVLIHDLAKKYGGRTALEYKDYGGTQWKHVSWNEFSNQVSRVSDALLALGVDVQEKIAVFSQNSIHYLYTDFGAWGVRACTIPLYATTSEETMQYVINEARIRYIFCGEQEQYDKARHVQNLCSSLQKIIIYDRSVTIAEHDPSSIYFDDFLNIGNIMNGSGEVQKRQQSATWDDLACILYTSGTTGQPKGVMLSQGQFHAALDANDKVLPLRETDRALNFLPFTHIFEKGWSILCLTKGVTLIVNTDPREVQKSMRETHPTCMSAVPRFWEKVYAGVITTIDSSGPMKKKLFRHALQVGRRHNIEYLSHGKKPPIALRIEYELMDKLVFRLVRKQLGLENAYFFPTAGSFVSPQVEEFVHSIGIFMMVGYGLTESLATVTADRLDMPYTIGSIGRPIDSIDIQFSDEGEILLKGPTVTQGYYNRPDLNEEAFTDAGYFRTGDVGYMKDGELYITERIKDLFKTSNGKYIAPQMIESKILVDKYVEQIAVVADKRKYVSALIVPVYSLLEEYARDNNIACANRQELCSNKKIRAMIADRIDTLQQTLAGYEQIKNFTLMPEPFTLDKGEITNTLKIKRGVLMKRYADIIEKMYVEK
ncbi:MAG: long-chain fatty acid--CoA ligase [Prevotella sp.]|nr:long-chain fatty acid--CoA ligase [Prevotella sp.]